MRYEVDDEDHARSEFSPSSVLGDGRIVLMVCAARRRYSATPSVVGVCMTLEVVHPQHSSRLLSLAHLTRHTRDIPAILFWQGGEGTKEMGKRERMGVQCNLITAITSAVNQSGFLFFLPSSS